MVILFSFKGNTRWQLVSISLRVAMAFKCSKEEKFWLTKWRVRPCWTFCSNFSRLQIRINNTKVSRCCSQTIRIILILRKIQIWWLSHYSILCLSRKFRLEWGESRIWEVGLYSILMDRNLPALHRQHNKESYVCQRMTDIKPYNSSFYGNLIIFWINLMMYHMNFE